MHIGLGAGVQRNGEKVRYVGGRSEIVLRMCRQTSAGYFVGPRVCSGVLMQVALASRKAIVCLFSEMLVVFCLVLVALCFFGATSEAQVSFRVMDFFESAWNKVPEA